MVRIPTHGPPTHPGEMLLEEFLKLAWDLYQAQHSPAARHIRKIRRHPRLAKVTR
jgi:plasmid maintenance system antidote protein VapI